jgi:hypothetical protein
MRSRAATSRKVRSSTSTRITARRSSGTSIADATTGGGTSPFSHWKVSTYATLCAEVGDAPAQRTDAILARFGVPDALTRAALDNHWRQVFAADPAKLAEFKQLLPIYLEYVRKGQG